MTSVDDLFKASGNSQKRRKIEHDPNKFYKPAVSRANGHSASVEDDENGDEAAGPNLASEPDLSDDEEGRFFGGGINKGTTDALNFLDERDQGQHQEAEKHDPAWLRKTALNFEKRISKNAELRAKYESEPQKFMSSEADLDADIKALSILSEHAHLYNEFASLGCVNSLVSLLAHENTDIAIDSIEILGELTADDVEADETNWQALFAALSNSDLPDLLIQNMERLDESNETDSIGLYHCLSLIENLSSDVAFVEKLTLEVGSSSPLLKWLLNRISKKETPTSQNKQYSAEILSILIQSSSKIQQQVVGLDGADLILQLLSAFRKRDPTKNSDEEEYAENLFDCLTCLVGDARGVSELSIATSGSTPIDVADATVQRKQMFVEAEGVELCLIMIREGKYSKPRALKILDHAMSGAYSTSVCERVVEAAGLKTIFGIFMKEHDHTTTEHLVGIFVSLLRCLPDQSPERLRTLAKFIEKDYEKVAKLIILRQHYARTFLPVDSSIKKEASALSPDERNEMSGTWLSRRLDAGLYCYQTMAVILAWLCAEDAGAKLFISKALEDDGGLANLQGVLREQLEDLQSDELGEKNGQFSIPDEEAVTVDMLRTLMDHLE